ncbi:hypothetical protein PG990_008495 [Apiospora arundinis]
MSELYSSHVLPADSRCTRVLDIFGVSTSADDEPIQCKLRVIPLDGTHAFTALSYVWGTYAADPQYILCDGIRVNVTTNCHSALLHLRKVLGKLTIWLDAVCINQNDDYEKTRQIPLMGDIYSKATTVYIWLGDGTPATNRAMDYMAKPVLARYYKAQADGTVKSSWLTAAWFLYSSTYNPKNHPTPFNDNYSPRSSVPLLRLIYKALSPRPKPRFGVNYPYATYSDLQELLNRPWITRLWTYQEILLATSPVMVCGDRHVPWPEFELSLCFLGNIETFSLLQIIHPWVNLILSRERLQKYDLAFRNSPPTALESYGLFVRKVSKAKTGILDAQSALAILTFVAALDIGSILGMSVPGLFISSIITIIFLFTVAKYRLQHVRGSSYFSNESFMIGLYHRNAKERRDMAFGMWAVLERGGALNLPAPDASLSIADIYRTFATHISQITQRADLILLAAIQGFDDQPSWVPDWSAHGNNNWAYDVAAIDKSDEFGDRSNLRALSTRPQVSFVFKERYTVLSIRARHVCEVYNCFRFQQANARDPDESVDAIHLNNLRVILELASSRPVFPAGSSRAFVNEAFGFETMTSIATFTNSNLFPFFILETLDLELEETMPQLNKAQFTRWRSFCISNCRKTPAEAMTLLQNAPDIRQI